MLADHRDGLSNSSFRFILNSSVGLSVSIQSAADLVSGALGSNPAFSRGTHLVSFRFYYRLPVPEHRNQQQQICISPEPGAKVNWQWGQVGWMLADHRDGLSNSSFCLILDSSVGLSVSIPSAADLVSWVPGSNPAFSRGTQLVSFGLEYRFPVQSIEINNNKYVYRQSQVRKSTDSGVKWAECSLIIGTGCRIQVFAWSSIAQSGCQWAFSLLAIWCLGPRVQIMHSAEEHILSPFDLNIACLCQSIDINNNKYVYRECQVRKSTDSGVKWAECSLIMGTGSRVQVFAWSSIAQLVCQWTFSLLAIRCLGPRVQVLHSAVEHNLSPFYLNIACLCQSIEINNNKYVYRQNQVRKSTDSGVKWAECSLIIGTGCRVQVFAWSSIAQSVCQWAISLLTIWCLGPRVQILHSTKEHNLSPFDLNIACLCQSIEMNNNKYVYRQSQVRKSTDRWVKWAECSLIIGTGCRVQVFAWSSIAKSVCQWAFSLLAIWCLGPRVQILHSAEEYNLSPFDLNIACLCQSIEINNNEYVYRQSQVRKSTDSGVKWAECSLIIGTGCRVQVFAWSSIAQSVCQWAFSLLAIWCLGPRVPILHSTEEHNLSPFDLNIACLCQSIEINNNKYVYRQSQVRKSTDSGVKWAECSLIMGRAVEFKFLLDPR